MRVILPADSEITPFRISINKDDIKEDNETFQITIIPNSLPYYITLGNQNTVYVTIIDSKYINYLCICSIILY